MKPKEFLSLSVIFCALLFIVSSCKKDSDPEPSFTSADGKWTYTTPDSKVMIDFEITNSSSSNVAINGTALTIEGTTVVPLTITDGINLPAIASMRFSANDAKLVYPYPITFTECTVSSDFKTIAVTSVEYTYSGGTKNLSSIVIKRP